MINSKHNYAQSVRRMAEWINLYYVPPISDLYIHVWTQRIKCNLGVLKRKSDCVVESGLFAIYVDSKAREGSCTILSLYFPILPPPPFAGVMGCAVAEATVLDFVCFVVINPRVLIANRVDFGLLCFINFSILLTPPPPPHSAEESRRHRGSKEETGWSQGHGSKTGL